MGWKSTIVVSRSAAREAVAKVAAVADPEMLGLLLDALLDRKGCNARVIPDREAGLSEARAEGEGAAGIDPDFAIEDDYLGRLAGELADSFASANDASSS